jgi:GDPmannose 4,6-dehydratase
MKRALITGVSGQDGSYLAELLLEKGYEVIGTVRNIERATRALPINVLQKIKLIEWDALSQEHITKLLLEYRPREVYNLAALSSGSAMYDDPVQICDVNGLAVARILESIRLIDNEIRFCQASSSEVFGDVLESPQCEGTSIRPRSPYGAAKAYGDAMVRIYRNNYNLFACSAILYNHESPRRGFEFVSRKISIGAAKIKLGLINELRLGNLTAKRDWGYAADYARGMWLMMQQSDANDFIFATGVLHSVSDIVNIAFTQLGLDYRDYVKEDAGSFRQNESIQLLGNPKKAIELLNWKSTLTFDELISTMVDHDLKRLKDIRV